MSRDMAEIDQMLSAPSDGYSAGEWCELANDLRARLEAAEAVARDARTFVDADQDQQPEEKRQQLMRSVTAWERSQETGKP